MKTRMKKLVVFVMIAAVVTFIAGATASVGDAAHVNIVGEYGFSGGGNGITTPVANWVALTNTVLDQTKVTGFSFTSYGTLIFEPKGKGSISFTLITIPDPPAWSPTTSTVTYTFTYEVKDDVITLDADPCTFKQMQTYPTPVTLYGDHHSLTGYVTADKKAMVIATPGVEADTIFVDDKCSLPPPGGLLKILVHERHVCHKLD